MKKLLCGIGLILVTTVARAEEKEEDIYDFTPGYYTYYQKIPKGACTSGTFNVYAKASGELSAIPGAYKIHSAALDGGVTGLFAWPSTTAVFGIAFTTNGSVYTNEGGSWTFRAGGFSKSAIWDCAFAKGRAYCMNQVDVPIVFFATSTSEAPRRVKTIPSGGCVEFDDERLWVSCVSSATTANGTVRGDPAFLYGSNSQDLEDFAIDAASVSAADAYFAPIGEGDGQVIIGLTVAGPYLVIGKEHTLWTKTGSDNTNWRYDKLKCNFGLASNASFVQHEGWLLGAAREGIWRWKYSGAPEIFTDKIQDEWRAVKYPVASNLSWTEDTESDWNLGVSTPAGNLSTTFRPGFVSWSSGTLIDDYNDDNYTTGLATWTVFGNGTVSIYNKQLDIVDNTNGGIVGAWTGDGITSSTANYSVKMTLGGASVVLDYFVMMSSYLPSNWDTQDPTYKLRVVNNCGGGNSVVQGYLYVPYNGIPSNQLVGPVTIPGSQCGAGVDYTLTIGRTAGGHFNARFQTIDKVYDIGIASNVPSTNDISTITYLGVGISLLTSNSSASRLVDDIYRQDIDASSWTSPVRTLFPDNVRWGIYGADLTDYNGVSVTSHSIRVATYSFLADASQSIIPWQTQTNYTSISTTVVNYVQTCTRFEKPTTYSDPALNKRFITYASSSDAIPPIAATANDGRAYFSVALASDTMNDRMYMIDKNWAVWPIKGLWAGALTVYKNDIWAASRKDLFVRKMWQNGAIDFDGESMEKIWKSGFMFLGSFDREKVLKDLIVTSRYEGFGVLRSRVELDALAGANVGVEETTSTVVLGGANAIGTNKILHLRPSFPSGQFNFRTIGISLKGETVTDRLEVYNLGIHYDLLDHY